jgi:NADPH2:quinone reductase
VRGQQIVALDGPSGLRMADVPEPDGTGRVVIEVVAAGVSFPDVLMSRGMYQLKPPLPFIPGLEVAGTVRQAPPGSGVAPGDRVVALVGQGGFAEVAAAEPRSVLPLPAGLSMEEAAGFVLNYHTAHFALARRARLRPGEIVAVHGAAGGLGSATLQVARGLGAHTVALVSSDEKAALARRAGADDVVDVRGDWPAALRRSHAGRGVDVVVDPVGGDRFDESLRCLAPEGRLLAVGFAGGRIPSVAANRLLLRNIAVVGAGWGAFLAVSPELLGETARALQPMLASGVVRPLVGAVLGLEQAAEALRLLEDRRAVGKVILSIA